MKDAHKKKLKKSEEGKRRNLSRFSRLCRSGGTYVERSRQTGENGDGPPCFPTKNLKKISRKIPKRLPVRQSDPQG